MSIYRKIQNFLSKDDQDPLELRDHSAWEIKSFEEDLERWKFPVKLIVGQCSKGRFPLRLEKVFTVKDKGE